MPIFQGLYTMPRSSENGSMSWTDWLGANWLDLAQTVGVVGGLLFTASSLRRDARMHRITNLFTLTSQHQALWLELSSRPSFARILQPTADLAKQPPTPEEVMYVNLLIQHLASGYEAVRASILGEPKGLAVDIRTFFTLPIPKAVWEQAKAIQEKAFVEFVEKRQE